MGIQHYISQEVVLSAAWFALAIALIDGFDISLPRGDSLSVSGALLVSGAVVLGSRGLVLMTAAGFLGLAVAFMLRRKRGRPGVLVVALSVRGAAIAALWLALVGIGLLPIAVPGVLIGMITALLYLSTELVMSQFILAWTNSRPFGRLLRGNIRRQALVVAAQVSVSALVIVTYPWMNAWSLLAVTAMLLLIRQSYALLLQMRETYQTTVGVLVEVAESQDTLLAGHAERTAHVARALCSRMGMSSVQVERASYAALLHNLDAIEGDCNCRKPGGRSAELLEGVAFLKDVVPILRLCDGVDVIDCLKESEQLTAMAVGLACEIDASERPGVSSLHTGSVLVRVATRVDGGVKARVVSAALELGYKTPAVN
jgi:hypothetical protein